MSAELIVLIAFVVYCFGIGIVRKVLEETCWLDDSTDEIMVAVLWPLTVPISLCYSLGKGMVTFFLWIYNSDIQKYFRKRD